MSFFRTFYWSTTVFYNQANTLLPLTIILWQYYIRSDYIYIYICVKLGFYHVVFYHWVFYHQANTLLTLTIIHQKRHIYICIFRQHFFVNANFIKHNRHFMSTYFLLDPFEFPYYFYRIQGGLIYVLSIVVCIPSTFCPTLGHHRRLYQGFRLHSQRKDGTNPTSVRHT